MRFYRCCKTKYFKFNKQHLFGLFFRVLVSTVVNSLTVSCKTHFYIKTVLRTSWLKPLIGHICTVRICFFLMPSVYLMQPSKIFNMVQNKPLGLCCREFYCNDPRCT